MEFRFSNQNARWDHDSLLLLLPWIKVKNCKSTQTIGTISYQNQLKDRDRLRCLRIFWKTTFSIIHDMKRNFFREKGQQTLNTHCMIVVTGERSDGKLKSENFIRRLWSSRLESIDGVRKLDRKNQNSINSLMKWNPLNSARILVRRRGVDSYCWQYFSVSCRQFFPLSPPIEKGDNNTDSDQYVYANWISAFCSQQFAINITKRDRQRRIQTHRNQRYRYDFINSQLNSYQNFCSFHFNRVSGGNDFAFCSATIFFFRISFFSVSFSIHQTEWTSWLCYRRPICNTKCRHMHAIFMLNADTHTQTQCVGFITFELRINIKYIHNSQQNAHIINW